MDHRHDNPEFDRGLQYDLTTLVKRRQVIRLLGGTSLLALISCSPSGGAITSLAGGTAPSTTEASTTGITTVNTTGIPVDPASCEVIPEETAGPFPGDGSNGPNVLTETGVVRQDIRSSIGSASGTAEGIQLTINLTIQDQAAGCVPMAGAAVYLWHCDREGNYSLYSEAAADQNYLRGVQATHDNGTLTFTSIFPGCYAGRWPHIHFEVYPNLEAATDEANKIATSQLAFPEDASSAAYATEGYEASIRNLAELSLASDGVFGENEAAQQMGTVTGSVEEGFTVSLTIAV